MGGFLCEELIEHIEKSWKCFPNHESAQNINPVLEVIRGQGIVFKIFQCVQSIPLIEKPLYDYLRKILKFFAKIWSKNGKGAVCVCTP